MTPAHTFNRQQFDRWNGADGEIWVQQQEAFERNLAPVTAPLLAFASPKADSTVIDIGCGCGATTLELATAVGPAGRVVGIDISGPMLNRAKERLADFKNVTCLLGDAATLPLSDIRAELAISRFGVMFFGDSAAAFTNIREGLAPGGRLRFACWRPIHENPWIEAPFRAIQKHIPELPKADPNEPGPFAFADPERVTSILISAGFTTPRFERLSIDIDLDPEGSPANAAIAASQRGPTKRALENQPEEVRAAALESIRAALAPYASSAGVKLRGSVSLVAAERA
jgi:SAM-dependent methyltransferase